MEEKKGGILTRLYPVCKAVGSWLHVQLLELGCGSNPCKDKELFNVSVSPSMLWGAIVQFDCSSENLLYSTMDASMHLNVTMSISEQLILMLYMLSAVSNLYELFVSKSVKFRVYDFDLYLEQACSVQICNKLK